MVLGDMFGSFEATLVLIIDLRNMFIVISGLSTLFAIDITICLTNKKKKNRKYKIFWSRVSSFLHSFTLVSFSTI